MTEFEEYLTWSRRRWCDQHPETDSMISTLCLLNLTRRGKYLQLYKEELSLAKWKYRVLFIFRSVEYQGKYGCCVAEEETVLVTKLLSLSCKCTLLYSCFVMLVQKLPRFCSASWLPVRHHQEGILEGYCKAEGGWKDFLPSFCACEHCPNIMSSPQQHHFLSSQSSSLTPFAVFPLHVEPSSICPALETAAGRRHPSFWDLASSPEGSSSKLERYQHQLSNPSGYDIWISALSF